MLVLLLLLPHLSSTRAEPQVGNKGNNNLSCRLVYFSIIFSISYVKIVVNIRRISLSCKFFRLIYNESLNVYDRWLSQWRNVGFLCLLLGFLLPMWHPKNNICSITKWWPNRQKCSKSLTTRLAAANLGMSAAAIFPVRSRINFDCAPSVVKMPAKTIALFINAATAGNYCKYHRCQVTSLPSCNLELAYCYQRSDSDAGRWTTGA